MCCIVCVWRLFVCFCILTRRTFLFTPTICTEKKQRQQCKKGNNNLTFWGDKPFWVNYILLPVVSWKAHQLWHRWISFKNVWNEHTRVFWLLWGRKIPHYHHDAPRFCGENLRLGLCTVLERIVLLDKIYFLEHSCFSKCPWFFSFYFDKQQAILMHSRTGFMRFLLDS